MLTPSIGQGGNNQLSIQLNVKDTPSYVLSNVGGFKDVASKINVVSYDKLQRTVGVIYVDEENDDIPVKDCGTAVDSAKQICVRPGKNKFLDTQISLRDSLGIDEVTRDAVIMAGRNKVCNSLAISKNIATPEIHCSLSTLKDSLNKIYQGTNVIFTDISKYPSKHLAINYDYDRDGLLDAVGTTEIRFLKNSVADSIKLAGDQFDYYLILVKNAKYIRGLAWLGRGGLFESNPRLFRFVLINVQPHLDRSIRTFTNTVGHELGHGCFDLQHPFDEKVILNKGYKKGSDPHNFMDYQDGHKSRKYQWNQIHENDKISRPGGRDY